jgi:hypothetical protein
VATVPKITSPAIVRPLATPTESLATYIGSNPPVFVKANQASDIATLGTVSQDVTTVHRVLEANTYAPYAARAPTLPSNAPSYPDLLVINTPFVPDEWEKMLNNISPFNRFPDVPIGMRFGFDMGVHSPPTITYTPPNHKSAVSFPDHVLSHIHKELSLGRYSGPFTSSQLESLIGPFRSSPLVTVPKSSDSSVRSILHDLSSPRNDPNFSSINSQINIDEFRCDWGTFNEIRTIVIDAPPLSEAATLDVNAAFRCCPITPSQQRNFIVY